MNQPSLDLCVVNYGLRSPTGTDAAMSIANVLTGICRKMRFSTIEDSNFEPVTLGVAEYLDKTATLSERTFRLLEGAWKEVIETFSQINRKVPVLKLFLGLPASRPGMDSNFLQRLQAKLQHLEILNDINLSTNYIREDHDAGIFALAKASDYLRSGAGEFVLIGGADSCVSQETVDWLEEKQWLKCSTNRKGYTPGEAACFCLLCAEQTAKAYNMPIKTRILTVATEQEPNLPGSEQPTAGRALTGAIASVLEFLPANEQIAETFCTLKGLPHEAEEFALTLSRIGNRFSHPGEFTTFQMNWGDIGAASVPALICYAAEKKALGFADPGHHLIFSLSPGGSRSAALIQTL
jgi:3-oxoacyl-[acyl-carrier-protein] synthase-1